MNPKIFLHLLVWVMVLGGPARLLAEQRRPNIVVLLADDLGYAELGVHGCVDIPTPRIDAIAHAGVRFTQGYVSAPCCAPSRAGLLTGRYQQRFGFEDNPGTGRVVDPNFGLPPDQETIGEFLKASGYATCLIGKWHVGYHPHLLPTARGFDEFFGFLPGGHSYLPPEMGMRLDAAEPGGERGLPGRNPGIVLRGTDEVREMEYLTTAFSREAVAFMRRHQEQPFLLFLSFNAVHEPMQATAADLARFPGITDPKRRFYAAMTAAMDDAVGHVIDTLRELRLEEQTLVFFLSDNGGPTRRTTSRNAPLRGEKFDVYEGGIRIPMLMQWKGVVPAGTVYTRPVSALDVFATAARAARAALRPDAIYDGVDLLPHVTGATDAPPHEALHWRFVNRRAIRAGNWKLLQNSSNSPVQLYDLDRDAGETEDLAAAHPEKVAELERLYAGWNEQLMAPRFTRGGGRTNTRK